MKREIFRQATLDRLASPEQLDRPIRLVGPLGWLGLSTIITAIAGAAAWAAFATAPVKVAGQGIVIQRGGLTEIIASDEGRIGELRLVPGQSVGAGDIVAVIVQSDLARQLENAQASLEAARNRYQRLEAFHAGSGERELAANADRMATIAETERLLKHRLRLLEERLKNVAALVARKTLVRDRLIDAEIAVSDTRERLAALDDEGALLELRRLERESERAIELLDQRLKVEEFERDVERLSRLYAERETIVSPHSGFVVEVKVNPGDVVAAGTALATLAPSAEGPDGSLLGLLYVPPADGKQVRPGMVVEIAPSTVRRAEFGYMLGRVLEVAPLPASLEGMRRTLQNDQLVRQLSGEGAPFEARIAIERDPTTPSGFRWSSSTGPNIEINAGTLIEGRVIVRRVRLANLLAPGLGRLLDSGRL